jgi:uncharacterized membrane protein
MVPLNYLRCLNPSQVKLRLTQCLEVMALSINKDEIGRVVSNWIANLINFKFIKVVIGPTHLWLQ